MCIDSQAMNKITTGYQFFIPRLDDLIYQLLSATFFSLLIWEEAIIKLE